MSDASSTFSLREFLQLVVPPVVALSLFTPLYSPLQGKVTIEGILFAGVVLGLLFSGPAGTVSTVVTKLIPIPSYRRRLNAVNAAGRLMRESLDFERLEPHLTKDDRELVDVLASLSICHRQTAMYLLFYVFFNAYSLTAAISSSQAILSSLNLLTVSPDFGAVIAAWDRITEPATPMLGGWSLPTIVTIAASFVAIFFLLRESLETKQALFGVQGLYNGYALKFQKQDAEIARAVWGQVLLNQTPRKDVMVVLRVLGSSDDRSETRTTQTDKYGLFCFPLASADKADNTRYEVSVENQAENASLKRGMISGLVLTLKPPDRKVPWIGRTLFRSGPQRAQAKRGTGSGPLAAGVDKPTKPTATTDVVQVVNDGTT